MLALGVRGWALACVGEYRRMWVSAGATWGAQRRTCVMRGVEVYVSCDACARKMRRLPALALGPAYHGRSRDRTHTRSAADRDAVDAVPAPPATCAKPVPLTSPPATPPTSHAPQMRPDYRASHPRPPPGGGGLPPSFPPGEEAGSDTQRSMSDRPPPQHTPALACPTPRLPSVVAPSHPKGEGCSKAELPRGSGSHLPSVVRG
jgi:hypothetical protein